MEFAILYIASVFLAGILFGWCEAIKDNHTDGKTAVWFCVAAVFMPPFVIVLCSAAITRHYLKKCME